MMLDYLNFCLSGKFLNRSEYQTTLPVSWETCVQVKKHKLELEKEQTGLKLGKEYNKAVIPEGAVVELTSVITRYF